MLEALILLLIVFWLIGFAFHIGGGIIHILLVVAVVVFIVRLLTDRSPRV